MYGWLVGEDNLEYEEIKHTQVPTLYVVVVKTPSSTCGPFSGNPNMYTTLQDALHTTPTWFHSFVFYIVSPGITIPIFVCVALAIYYMTAVSHSQLEAIKVSVYQGNQYIMCTYKTTFFPQELKLLVCDERDNNRELLKKLSKHGNGGSGDDDDDLDDPTSAIFSTETSVTQLDSAADDRQINNIEQHY